MPPDKKDKKVDSLGRRRNGQGMPKGTILPKTLQKLEGKARLRELVLKELDPIVRGLIAKATGVNHMMLRDPTSGQFIRLTEQDQIEKALNAEGAKEGSTFWIHTKDPDVQAASDLLNRAIGKAIEEINTTVTFNEPLAEKIKTAKARIGS